MNRLIFDTIKADFETFQPSLKVVLNNEEFNPSVRQSFVRIYLSPTNTVQNSLGEDRQIRFEGYFDMEVNQPVGINHQLLLDSIVKRYLKINTLNNITIINAMLTPAIVESHRHKVIIRIQYQGVQE